ncbi:thymidine phosphorylase [Clostridiaceae bacterium OttesenSCG-928-D20]|nr:thymidine phosphorylase [Clostridiaceae bacterium OttesenSCG-928-D20]
MLMSALIAKKRDALELSTEEIDFIVDGFTRGDIPDYQMSAMLMAIYIRGMSHRETVDLTLAMVRSGDVIDLSSIDGILADKHSTGGVGDKTSLILCPLVASCGVKMAKMSGRGLGHTGGTVDKLESIPGFRCDLPSEQFMSNINKVGFAIAGQTANLVPADKKLYALRDVTGTVSSMPLIVSSIMSKKLASGADVIVLDVKSGSGGFMKNDEDAVALAREMVQVGNSAGKKTIALVTDMDQPLGSAIGNALEVKEAISVLKGETKGALLELCIELGAAILVAAEKSKSFDDARIILQESIDSGRALEKFAEFVTAQGGNPDIISRPELLKAAPICHPVVSAATGYVQHIDAEALGMLCLSLGGGRKKKDSAIDHSVGITINISIGDHISVGETIASIHASSFDRIQEHAARLQESIVISDEPVAARALIRSKES